MSGAGSGAAIVLAAAELRSALRGRFVQGFGMLFALLAIGIAVAGLSASGQLLVQGFTRTAVSLLPFALYLLPLLGLVLGAGAFGDEDGGTELLLAQPVGRVTVLLGRTAGLAAALMAVGLAGFGIAAAVVGTAAGGAGAGGYLVVAAAALAVGLFGLAVGVLIGVLTRRRLRAISGALAAWFVLAVLFDFVAIMLLQFVGTGEPGPYLVGLLAINPVDGLRALCLVLLGADVLLGPTGAAMAQLLGPTGGGALVVGALVLWTLLALALAGRVYHRRDF